MSFFRHGKDYQPDGAVAKRKSGPQTDPLSTIGLDESPASIPWRVALQQSSPLLHQPPEILNQNR